MPIYCSPPSFLLSVRQCLLLLVFDKSCEPSLRLSSIASVTNMDKRLLWVSIIGILTMVVLTMIIIVLFVYVGINDTNHDRPLVIISLDGFRPDYLSASLTPNLMRLRKEGCFGTMKPVFTSETFPNHLSIATGLYAESHGIVSNNIYDPVLKQFFSKSDDSPLWWDNNYATPIWVCQGCEMNLLYFS